MTLLRLLLLATTLFVAACATVTTQVVPLGPAQVFPPTQYVEVLLEKPARAHMQIALLESRGGSEAEMLNDARAKAGALGADAIVRLETERYYQPPIALYDPWYDPFYWGYHRSFHPFMQPWGPYRVVGGGVSYVLKAMAVKYTDSAS